MKGSRRSKKSLSSLRQQKNGSLHSVNSISSLSQHRLHLFRETFHMMDQDRDGVITKDDLRSLYESLGQQIKDKQMDEMLAEVSGPMNHTKFTLMMASKAGDVDDSKVLLHAFAILDKEGTGRIPVKDLCKMLRTVGYERMTHEEISSMLKVAPVDGIGMLDYRKFVQMIRGEI